MAKDPAFSFYAQDYLVDTFQWDRGSKSLHVDLLAISWINGFIEADMNGVPLNLTSEDLQLWHARVKHKWELREGKLFNSRLEDGREKRKKFLEGQSEKGKISAEKRAKKVKKSTKKEPRFNHGSTTVQQGLNHLKTENEIEKEYGEEFLDGGTGEEFAVTHDLVLPKATLEAAELNQFTLTRNKNTEHIQSQWGVFLAERIHDPPEKRCQYRQLSDLTTYFLNWIRTKHPKNDATNRPINASSGSKPGTSEARINRAKEWGRKQV
jgi:hypothetical protein